MVCLDKSQSHQGKKIELWKCLLLIMVNKLAPQPSCQEQLGKLGKTESVLKALEK